MQLMACPEGLTVVRVSMGTTVIEPDQSFDELGAEDGCTFSVQTVEVTEEAIEVAIDDELLDLDEIIKSADLPPLHGPSAPMPINLSQRLDPLAERHSTLK